MDYISLDDLSSFDDCILIITSYQDDYDYSFFHSNEWCTIQIWFNELYKKSQICNSLSDIDYMKISNDYKKIIYFYWLNDDIPRDFGINNHDDYEKSLFIKKMINGKIKYIGNLRNNLQKQINEFYEKYKYIKSCNVTLLE